MTLAIDDLLATVLRLMRSYTGAWALCGGWAIDAWVGRTTREHGDVDIAVFLDEQNLFHTQLADWHLVAHETKDAEHHDPWDGHDLRPASHLHAEGDQGPRRELHVNERDLGEGTWTLRRLTGARETLPLARFALPGPHAVPLIAPEALQYYKLSGEVRPQDADDVAILWELIDATGRDWLNGALKSSLHRPRRLSRSATRD